MSDRTDDNQTQVYTRVELEAGDTGSDRARLVVIQGPELGRQFSIDRQARVIGRAAECDLRLSAAGISRRHCRIDFRDGHYWIEDLGSTNHTRINEVVCEAQALEDGDRIRLGQTVLKYIAPDNPEAAWLDQLQEQASHDPETGLLNRHYFLGRLEAAVAAASATPEEAGGGAIYLKLDESAAIRDRVGMHGIDRLLGRIGRRITDTLGDDGLPARLGEHTLALLITGLDESELSAQAEALRQCIAERVFEIDRQEVAASASLGLCPFNLRIGDADTLLVCAARAADQAQAAGGNRCQGYQPEVSAAGASDDERSMAGLLREALKKNRLQTLFQPAVSTGEDPLTHYQLLPRLLTDDDQLIAAAEFIQVAARHGQVLALDRWMSVRAMTVIREQLARKKPLRLFIAQSAESLNDADRFESLAKNLESGITGQRLLVLEFRQDDLNDHLKAARSLLPRLRELGFGISVSGVGDETRPELLLNHFDIDYVKLTPRFAEGIGHDRQVSRQFDRLAETFQGAGTRIIISHVEDAETMGRLWNSKADLLQGNFIQKPTQTPDFTLEED
jgi:diguanylate cyclase (GGDEF)-like protein